MSEIIPKAIPNDAICAVDGCAHPFGQHFIKSCRACDVKNEKHEFKPARLAGGVWSPSAEQGAYVRAMRGEL